MAYFKNSDFDLLFVEWKQIQVSNPRKLAIEAKMAGMITTMVTNLIRHPFYVRYPEEFRKDMIQEGVIQIWIKVGGFDRSVGTNYFAYFTSVAKNAFIAQLRDHYKNKNRNIPLDVMENFLAEDEK